MTMTVKNKTLGKRKASTSMGSSKRTKLTSKTGKAKTKGKEKEHAYDKSSIPIPRNSDESDSEVSGDELQFFAEDAEAASRFLKNLDVKGIARSKKEQVRLHRLARPQQRASAKADDLPSIASHSEDDGSWNSDIDEGDNSDALIHSDDDSGSSSSSHQIRSKMSRRPSDDEEMPYEMLPRKRRKSWDSEEEKGISRLPIKLQNGRIQKSEQKVIPRGQEEQDGDSSDEEGSVEIQEAAPREDVAIGARFGRPAVLDVISTKSRGARVRAAKEQIASISQDIVADPENGIGLLRRLHTFCQPQVSAPSHPEPVPNDPLIRKLALLSQLAVFKDIIPGYRIRPLTDKEKEEKVSQIVQQTRDFEQDLVSVYQVYLRVLESELKEKGELMDTALQCICRLLSDVTHFNFRVNLMAAVVARLSRKTWDEVNTPFLLEEFLLTGLQSATKSSELCLKTLSSILRTDVLGQASLEIVRLLNRMIKERRFNVHPNVMVCLLELRLKTELGGVRASQSKADKERPEDTMSKSKAVSRRAKGKSKAQSHLSKKARKNLREVRGIEQEMREANAEVDREERASLQTETLKLLFALYFRILKSDKPIPLLPAALQGISRFAHLVNIDFFRDLLQVLREHVSRAIKADEIRDGAVREEDEGLVMPDVRDIHQRLHCIATAFELLSGQGEALNVDLTDFINRLYALMIPLSSMPSIEEPIVGTRASRGSGSGTRGDTPVNMLFHALNLVFFPRGAAAQSPPWRTAAFAKRLLTASLYFPSSAAARAIKFVQSLFAKEPKLEALLSVEDRVTNGMYRPDIDDPQLSNPFATNLWELQLLSDSHGDQEVSRLAGELLHFSRREA